MASEGGGPGAAFAASRANLRETAKWMVTALAGIAALMVASSTLSKLGSMEIDGRFYLAVAALAFSSFLCWFPFQMAIRVLRSEVLSLGFFVDGKAKVKARDVIKARVKIEDLLERQLPNGLKPYVDGYSAKWKAIDTNGKSDAEKDADRAAIEQNRELVRQACITALVGVRFDDFANTLRWSAGLILVGFLVFAWAANPPEDPSIKLYDRPYVQGISKASMAKLEEKHMSQKCMSGAQLTMIAAPAAGPQTGLVTAPGCATWKVTVSNGEIVRVDSGA